MSIFTVPCQMMPKGQSFHCPLVSLWLHRAAGIGRERGKTTYPFRVSELNIHKTRGQWPHRSVCKVAWYWWGRLHVFLYLSSLQMAYLAKCRECVIYGTGSMKCSNLTVQTVGNRNIYGTGSISLRPWAIEQRCMLIKICLKWVV